MNKYKLLYFLGGFAVGAVAGIFGYRTYLINSYEDPEEDYSEYERMDEEEVNPTMSDEEEQEIKERLERGYEATTNYAAMYQGDAANHEHPVDSDEDGDYTDEDAAYDETVEHNQNKGKKPKIISIEAVADLPGYVDQETLLYYQDTGILTNEDDEEIPDPETFIGDALTKYGFADNDEDRIWVMNYALDMCYEVQKVN